MHNGARVEIACTPCNNHRLYHRNFSLINSEFTSTATQENAKLPISNRRKDTFLRAFKLFFIT